MALFSSQRNTLSYNRKFPSRYKTNIQKESDPFFLFGKFSGTTHKTTGSVLRKYTHYVHDLWWTHKRMLIHTAVSTKKFCQSFRFIETLMKIPIQRNNTHKKTPVPAIYVRAYTPPLYLKQYFYVTLKPVYNNSRLAENSKYMHICARMTDTTRYIYMYHQFGERKSHCTYYKWCTIWPYNAKPVSHWNLYTR